MQDDFQPQIPQNSESLDDAGAEVLAYTEHEVVHSSNLEKSTFSIHRKTLLAGIIPSALVLLLLTGFISWRIINNSDSGQQASTESTTNSVDLSKFKLSVESFTEADELLINGNLVVNKTLVLSPQAEPTNPQTGQIYYDNTDKVARIYDGTGFRRLLAAESNDNVCFVNGDCGFSTTGTANVLNTRIATAETTIARLVTQQPTGTTTTDLSGVNASIAQLQSDVAAIPPTPSLASYFQNGGNSFGTTATLGTSTNNSLNLLTNNQTRAIITDTGNLAVDTDTLFVDATNNRVGVGTATPTAKFEVIGSSVLGGTTTTGDLIPLTPGSTTQGVVDNDVLTINNQTSIYNDSQKFIAMGLDNLPRFTYFDNSYEDVHYVRCLDEDCQTFNDTIISSNPDGQDAPTIKIGTDGFARIVYINWSDPQEIHYVQCLDDNCISRNDKIVDSGGSYYEISFALDASDNAQIVYNDYDNSEIGFAQCANADCSSVNLYDINSFGYGSTYGIEVGLDGFARISYYDNNEIIFIKCNNQDCSSNNVQVAATGLASSSYYNDLVLDTNDLGRIAYTDRDGTGLKLITCLDDICSSSSSIIVDAAAINVQFSLNIDSNDRARVAYQNIPYRTGFKYAYCNNSACSSLTITEIDTVGSYPLSLATGSDDLSTIFHVGADDTVIKIARLGTEDGQDSSVYGTSLGSNTAYFGQGYMQGLNIQAASSSSLLSLENAHKNGELIDFKVSGTKIGSIGVTEDSIELRSTSGVAVLGVNTANSTVAITGKLDVSSSTGSSVFVVDSVNGSVSVSSTKDISNAFQLQDSSGSSVLNVSSKDKSLIIGVDADSVGYDSVSYSTGNNSSPASVTSADLDGDGDIDLATANYSANNVSVLLNNGDGTYAPKVDYPTGLFAFSVTSADLDGDGDIDLATANYNANNVSVLLNNGDGTYAPKVDYPTGTRPISVTSADFDGDGDIDLAVANNGSNNVSVLLNNGDGTYAPRVNYPAGSQPQSVTSADFDGDIDIDLAVANSGSNNVSVLLNNGDGTYAPRVNYPAGSSPHSVTSADFDGDGDIDLATANYSANNVSVLLNNGNGTFATKVDYPAGSQSVSVTSADFDGDGDIDLATANYTANNLSILINTGYGTYAPRVNYQTGTNPRSVTSADFDGDGDIDLAVANNGSNTVSILHIRQSNTYKPPALRLYTSGNDAVQVQGLNNKQIFRVDGQGSATIGGTESVQKVMFANKVDYPTGNTPYSVSPADLDGDGDIDLAVANFSSNNVSVLLNNGNGTYASRVNYPTGNTPYSVSPADLDGDGDIDLITANFSSNNISVLLNNGNGTYASNVNYPTGLYPYSVYPADLDGDGDIDIAAANDNSGSVSILLNNGNGTFASKVDYPTGGNPQSIAAFDLDGDGDIDLATANYSSNTLSILLNNGNGTFAPRVDYPTRSNPRSVTSADLDNDGDIDLATTNDSSNTVSILLNNGNGTFALKVDYLTNTDPKSVTSADLDNDGDIDLATSNTGSKTISLLFNNGDGTYASKIDYEPGFSGVSYSITSADLDGDGDIDLATADASNILSVFMNLYGNSFTTTGRLTVYDTAGSSQILNLGLTGNLNLQNTVNSTSAFNINNAAGSSLFNVDTLNSRISITSRTNNATALTVNNSSNQPVLTVDTLNSSVNVQSRTNNTSAFAVQNSAGATVLSVNTLNGTLTVSGKIITANLSGTTTVAPGANAGAGATTSVAGNDTSGTVTITTGTGSAAGILGTVTFSSAYSATPRIVMTPANANGSTLQYFYNATTGNFTIRTNNAPVDATQYQFTYWAVQ
jgi:hypothetical protein